MSVIEIQGAGKRYIKYKDRPGLLKRAWSLRNRTQKSHFWAIRDVNLEVEEGECVGVIGRNGSGKSTMLQLVAGTTRPSEGRVIVQGRVAPLISVGVGFHPELTGRENVFINGMILGMSKEQLTKRFDSIVAFSEIEAFIDTPVKFYSSGMFVRLGFSVAIHVEPEVLLVDEVLAVGDLAFQLKCFERISEIRESGSTILVVSHNLNAIRRLCNRAMLLHDGTHRYTGDTEEAISLFHEVINEPRELEDSVEPGAWERGLVTIESLEVLDAEGRAGGSVPGHAPMTVRMNLRFDGRVESPVFGLSVHNETGVAVYSDSSRPGRKRVYRPGERVTCDIVLQNSLSTGTYRVTAGVFKSDMKTSLARTRPTAFFVSGRKAGGIADLAAQFEVTRVADTDGMEASA
jgi:ABC-type polysaccharide/polyol phosphate transport system ATPase subunit